VDEVLLNDQHAIPSMSGCLLANCDSWLFRYSIAVDGVVRNKLNELGGPWLRDSNYNNYDRSQGHIQCLF